MAEKEDKGIVSHARRFLLDLLNGRQLNSWCEERNLPHTTVYNLASEDMPPTYSAICKLLPYIEPAKWFYPENIEIPYKMKKLPELKSDEVCAFVRKHRYDYKEIAEKYGISESTALNLFINHRTKPSVMLISKACRDVNPEEFFIAAKPEENGKFYPDRGDIVALSEKAILVLSKKTANQKNNSFFGISFKNSAADISTVMSYTYSRNMPEVIGKADDEMLKDVLNQVKSLLK